MMQDGVAHPEMMSANADIKAPNVIDFMVDRSFSRFESTKSCGLSD
jgi:hypothetical protein